jgi:hypothetical protein
MRFLDKMRQSRDVVRGWSGLGGTRTTVLRNVAQSVSRVHEGDVRL